MNMRKFGTNKEPQIGQWVIFKILNIDANWSDWTMAGALKSGVLEVSCHAEC